MQELLAIPDRQRTDEEWDELNELEIMLASANREGAPVPGQYRKGHPSPVHHNGNNSGGNHGRRQKKFHNRQQQKRSNNNGNGR
jgi:hypothetical protein